MTVQSSFCPNLSTVGSRAVRLVQVEPGVGDLGVLSAAWVFSAVFVVLLSTTVVEGVKGNE